MINWLPPIGSALPGMAQPVLAKCRHRHDSSIFFCFAQRLPSKSFINQNWWVWAPLLDNHVNSMLDVNKDDPVDVDKDYFWGDMDVIGWQYLEEPE